MIESEQCEVWRGLASEMTFLGNPVPSLTHKELLAVVGYLLEEKTRLQAESERYQRMAFVCRPA